MDTIGTFEAKTHLTRLLDRVAAGEQITITRHGTPIARLVPVKPTGSRQIRETIAKLKERGVTFDLDKLETPVCWMAQFRDPDGNKLVVHKRKANA